MNKIKLDTIEEAIEDFRKGEFVIVVDDEDRENEGDLIIAAELITPEKVNFMLKHARGVLCAPITISRCKELDLPHQVSNNTSVLGTPFTALNTLMSKWLESLSGANSILLGMILGGMMAIDMAGPIGKAAYFFGVASLTNLAPGQTSIVMAAVMAAGMVPPLGLALASLVAKDKFTLEEREAGKTAWVLGLSFITEGAMA